MTDTSPAYRAADAQVIAQTLQRLRGQFATPPGTPRDHIEFITANGLGRFNEYPSGHWSITERGAEFISEQLGGGDD